jgi:predicted short-subunit dehydrogenase-like oxidoreductase (DUF2520 family)
VNIVLIGAGNVATHLGLALKEKGFSIVQVYSRTAAAAETLGRRLQTAHTHRLEAIIRDADVYFFSVKDAALPLVLKNFPPVEGLCLHTAGSLPMDIFRGSAATRYGVFYPLQTFSRARALSFDHIPLCLETGRTEDRPLLEHLARALSDTVLFLSSEQRKRLHLAAVFACNFTNHLCGVAAQMLEEQAMDWQLLLPLIDETAAKLHTLSPREAQTGPAVRRDAPVIDEQLELLKHHPDRYALYRSLTQSIDSLHADTES